MPNGSGQGDPRAQAMNARHENESLRMRVILLEKQVAQLQKVVSRINDTRTDLGAVLDGLGDDKVIQWITK